MECVGLTGDTCLIFGLKNSADGAPLSDGEDQGAGAGLEKEDQELS